MREISFGLGAEEFDINGKYTARFNPADIEFAARMWEVLDKIEARARTYQADAAKSQDGAAFFAELRKFNAEIAGWVDGLLGDGASAAIFGEVSPLAFSDGLPVCEIVLLELLGRMTDSYSEQRRRTDAKLKQYTGKYGA